MRPIGLLVALLGIAAIVAAAVLARPSLLQTETLTSIGDVTDTPPPAPQPQLQEGKREPKPVRPIAPAVVAAPPVEFETLERVEARAPLSDVALAQPPEPPERVRIFRPVAVAAGRLEAQGAAVLISGIAPVEPDEACAGEGGREWPCGMVARTAFRNFLRGRAVECRTPRDPSGPSAPTDCLVGEQDIGEWLVAQGWARAAPGGPYLEAEQAARTARLGIHGPGPADGE